MSWRPADIVTILLELLTEQLQRSLRYHVGLSQDGGACTYQNLVARELHGLCRHVCIANGAFRRGHVGLLNGECPDGEVEPVL